MGKRYVSLDQANELIGHIGPILQRVMQLHAWLRFTAEGLSQFGVRLSAPLVAGQELFGVPEIDRVILRARAIFYSIRDDIALLEDLGAEVRDVETGLVDFRTLHEGRREVHLNWRLGEPRITTYQDVADPSMPQHPVEGHAFLDTPGRTSRVE